MSKRPVYSMILIFVLVGVFGVAVEVQRVGASGTIYIRSDGSVEGTTHITSVDNITYTFTGNINDQIVIEKSNIIIDGNGNTLQGSGSWGSSGFSLTNISNVTIKNTNIDYFIYGIHINSTSQTTISDNSITNNTIGVYLNNSFSNTVSRNLVAGGDYGVNFFSSSGNTVSENNIANNTIYGVRLAESSFDNTVALNNITNNYYGVYIESSSSHNTISSNNVTDSSGYGIVVYASSNNDIYGNNLANNDCGVYLGDSFDNTVSGNTVTASSNGISLVSSSNNTISGNNIAENNLYGIQLFTSSNNTISGNNIANNTNQVYIHDSVNTWDNGYPSGGNYWSDYNGTDSFSGPYQNLPGSDFIGDTPYVMNSNNTDHYPLMIPYETEPPIITILSPENKTYSANAVPLTLTVDEATSWIGYSLDGQANVTITENTTLSDFSTGSHYVVVYASDPFGNMGASNTVYFTVDATFPTISILSPENKTYTVSDVPLTFTVSEPTSWMGYSLNGQTNVTISGNTTIFDLYEGVHTVIVYANDTIGNMGYSDTVYFTVDTATPNIEILSPENKTYPTGSVSLSFTVDEATSWIGYSLDGQANVTITGNTTLTGLSDGIYSLVVYASDIAGNIGSSDMVCFTMDTTPPSITIVSPENKTYDTTGIPLTFTIDESVLWMAYSLDAQANVTITGNTTLYGLSNDFHALVVYARDMAGNIGSSEIVYFGLETQQPDPQSPEPLQPWIVATIVIIAVVGTGLLVYFIKVKKPTEKNM